MSQRLSDSQVIVLAAELNHILWTTDTPQLDPEIAVTCGADVQLIGGNFQCVAHSVVCAALLLRRGENVITRAGSALVVYPEQRRSERPHFIAKHWWITTSEGLCDLSLNLEGLSAHKPIIFGNRNLSDSKWKVVFKHDFKSLLDSAAKSQTEDVCGVFYQTDNKLSVTKEQLEFDLNKIFDAAETAGVHLRYLNIVIHCESLLSGGNSLRQLPQLEAWRYLAANG